MTSKQIWRARLEDDQSVYSKSVKTNLIITREIIITIESLN